ncbi:MAG: zinc-dependent alcohol dehydrogenase family protein [Acidobacteriia bacterium]|nr:zinc-dependent alcohol dehydrogenase family protein [Terriglobia bacterium]
MRAMVLDQPLPAEQNPLQLREVPLPEPRTGEIRVRVRCCGVCRTDLHIVEGDLKLPRLPVVPGHQVVGVVDATGPEVKLFREGDRVGVPWLYSTDGDCPFCRRGQENLCDNAHFTGFHVDGGYAEAVIVRQDFAYSIPPQFDDEHAAPLLCAGVIGYRSLKLSNVRPGERLGMYGFGGSAHIVLQIARHLGCEVLVFTRGAAHRELATKLGASWVGTAQDQPPAPLDSAIIFAPAGSLVPEALRHLRKGGTVALAGITMSQIPAMNYDLLYHEHVLRSAANSTRDDVRDCLRLAAEVPVRTEVQSFPLQQANQALQDLKHSRIGGAGVLRISED